MSHKHTDSFSLKRVALAVVVVVLTSVVAVVTAAWVYSLRADSQNLNAVVVFDEHIERSVICQRVMGLEIRLYPTPQNPKAA